MNQQKESQKEIKEENTAAPVGRVVLKSMISVVGLGLVSFGTWQIYAPAAPIVCGVLLLASVIPWRQPQPQPKVPPPPVETVR